MMRWIPLLLLPALLLLAVACDDGGDDGETPTATLEVAASGCDPVRPHTAGTFPDETITTSDGRDREYILHIPASYSGAEAVAIVLNFHGFALTDDGYSEYTGLNVKAEEAGFIAVTPQGMTTESTDLPHWNSGALAEPEPDDVAFVDELLDALEAQLCADPARVYATGFSNGAGMAVRLACNLSDRIAAIGPVAGVSFPTAMEGEPGCAATRPVPVIAFHGTADPLVPFDGSEPDAPFSRRDVDDEIMPDWAEHNGCASLSEQDPVPGTTGVRLVGYEDCDEDATVELYVIVDADPDSPGEQGGGHTWPGATRGEPGDADNPTTQEISANDLIWDFFQSHPMP